MKSTYAAMSTAATVDEVVRLAHDFVASLDSEDLGQLPHSCRPSPVRSVRDIEYWADRLCAEARRVKLFMEDERKLDALASRFLIASVRIRQIAAA